MFKKIFLKRIILISIFFLFSITFKLSADSPDKLYGRIRDNMTKNGGFTLAYIVSSSISSLNISGGVYFRLPFQLRIDVNSKNGGRVSFVYEEDKSYIITGSDDIIFEIPPYIEKKSRFGKISGTIEQFDKRIFRLIKKNHISIKKIGISTLVGVENIKNHKKYELLFDENLFPLWIKEYNENHKILSEIKIINFKLRKPDVEIFKINNDKIFKLFSFL